VLFAILILEIKGKKSQKKQSCQNFVKVSTQDFVLITTNSSLFNNEGSSVNKRTR
jgi:hypothetical protein